MSGQTPMHDETAVGEIASMIRKKQAAITSIDRKRSWRPAERAMAKAGLMQEIKALEKAKAVLSGTKTYEVVCILSGGKGSEIVDGTFMKDELESARALFAKQTDTAARERLGVEYELRVVRKSLVAPRFTPNSVALDKADA